MAKQERFVAEERKKIEEAKKAFESERAEVEKYRKLKDLDPFDILEHFGVTYEKLLESEQKRTQDPIKLIEKRANEKIEELRKELAAKDEERIRSSEQEKLSRAEIKLKADIEQTIKSKEFDLIELLGEQRAVRDYMEDVYERTGVIPDLEEACKVINDELVERYTKVKSSKWLQAKEEVSPAIDIEAPSKKHETLSNKMIQSTVSSDKPMTEKERLSAAIAAMAAVKSK